MVNLQASQIGVKLNQDTHPILLNDRDLVFMLNGDIEDVSNQGNSLFAQNQLSNRICYNAPAGHEYVGHIDVDKNQSVLFYKTPTSNIILLLNKNICEVSQIADQPCLNLDPAYPIRGVYKYNNRSNTREIYWVDGKNPDRYLDIDSPFPLRRNSSCDNCTEPEEPSCDELRIVRKISIPDIKITIVDSGSTLENGLYQVGIGHSFETQSVSDLYYSRPVTLKKGQSIRVDIGCMDNTEDYIRVVLLGKTKATPLAAYNFGIISSTNQSLVINSLPSEVISTEEALAKRSVYDTSQHITNNAEVLVRAVHNSVSNITYQPLANQIDVSWVTFAVPKEKSHQYTSLMRDEVYAFAIKWYDCVGRNRGVFEIPNKSNPLYNFNYATNNYLDTDIVPTGIDTYIPEDECVVENHYIWEVTNTSTLTATNTVTCGCDTPINREGKCGYYESKDFSYPEEFGFNCQKIRRFRMPNTNLAPIHECETCTNKSDCVYVLGLKLENIQIPTEEGITHYEILYSDRSGNESILHKGLIFNMGSYQEGYYENQDDENSWIPEETIYYPNYPNNDLQPDPFLVQRNPVLTHEDWIIPHLNQFEQDRFTYHSPDIHYSERRNEFASAIRIYNEEIGFIDGKFSETYLHGKRNLDNAYTTSVVYPFYNFGWQYDSSTNYDGCVPSTLGELNTFKLEERQYLLPIKQITGKEKIKINANQREESYYFKTEKDIPNPVTVDTTRLLFTDVNASNGLLGLVETDEDGRYVRSCPKFIFPNPGGTTLDGRQIQAVSYYTGVYNYQRNQYGNIYSPAFIPFGKVFSIEGTTPQTALVMGGDIYVTKHSIQRKMPFFTTFDDTVENIDGFEYKTYSNIAYPEFWYATNIGGGADYWVLNTHYGNPTNRYITTTGDSVNYHMPEVKPKMYTSVNTMIYFWGESRFISDFREDDISVKSNHLPTANYDVQTKGEDIRLPELFVYNANFNNTPIEKFYQVRSSASDASYISSYSNKNDLESGKNRWLEFLPLNYTLLPSVYGQFTGLHNVGNNIWFIFEDGILSTQQDYSITSQDGTSIFFGQGDIFTRNMRLLSAEYTGYTGSVDPLSFINTRYGTYFYDRGRHKWFHFAGGISEINRSMFPWFQAYVPGERDLTNGKLYKESIVTVFDNYTDNVYMTMGEDKATVTYKPKTESIISFNSFKPTNYIKANNNFLSVKANDVWKHDDKNTLMYCNYYGVQYPYKVGIVIKSPQNTKVQHINVTADFLKRPESDIHYAKHVQDLGKFFDKGVVFNHRHSTGLKDLILVDNTNPAHDFIQNQHNGGVMEVTAEYENMYSFNKLSNHQLNPILTNFEFVPTGDDYTIVNIDNNINPRQLGLIEGRWYKLFLESTNPSQHKILLQLETAKTDINL